MKKLISLFVVAILVSGCASLYSSRRTLLDDMRANNLLSDDEYKVVFIELDGIAGIENFTYRDLISISEADLQSAEGSLEDKITVLKIIDFYKKDKKDHLDDKVGSLVDCTEYLYRKKVLTKEEYDKSLAEAKLADSANQVVHYENLLLILDEKISNEKNENMQELMARVRRFAQVEYDKAVIRKQEEERFVALAVDFVSARISDAQRRNVYSAYDGRQIGYVQNGKLYQY